MYVFVWSENWKEVRTFVSKWPLNKKQKTLLQKQHSNKTKCTLFVPYRTTNNNDLSKKKVNE